MQTLDTIFPDIGKELQKLDLLEAQSAFGVSEQLLALGSLRSSKIEACGFESFGP